jgi:hypothetical protein
MQNPLQITFHDLQHNEEIEGLIIEKFEKLKVVSPDITKCHVRLEKLSKHHLKANSACARLDLKVSHFDDIVITEKCNEDTGSLKSAVLKILKNGLLRVREGLKYRKDRIRPARKNRRTVVIEKDKEEEDDL